MDSEYYGRLKCSEILKNNWISAYPFEEYDTSMIQEIKWLSESQKYLGPHTTLMTCDFTMETRTVAESKETFLRS